MSITADIIRGHTEMIILAMLKANDSYGYEIGKNISLATNARYEMKDATLYSAFRRLENSGFITSYWGAGDLGARRRYYRITDAGNAALERSRTDWTQAKKIIDTLIGE